MGNYDLDNVNEQKEGSESDSEGLWIAFAKYSYKQLKWAIVEKPFAREAYVSGKLEDSWKELGSEIRESFDDFSKDYYVVFE